MRKRPLSHQLEDQSKTAFRAILPKEWVVREKSHDYGIDLEVEIFDKKGASTGAVFLVQLKATASKKAATQASLQIAISAMEYFDSLDLPVLIARYSSKKNIFFVRWAHEVPLFKKKPDQKQLSIRFESESVWSKDSAEEIQKTVFALRRIKKLTSKSVIPINCRFEISDKGLNTARLKRIVRNEISPVKKLNLVTSDPQDRATVEAVIRDDHIFLSLDGLWPTTSPICDNINEDLISSLLYALCMLLHRASLYSHSQIIAKFLHKNEFVTKNRELACVASLSLASEPKHSTELAIWNGLHKQIDQWFMLYVPQLMKSDATDSERVESLVGFYESALEALRLVAPAGTLASLNYSIGNAYKSVRQYGNAIKHYNRACKQHPPYLVRDYFLAEVGSALFLSRKYRCAAVAYEKLVSISSDERSLFCYGDALFLSGRITEALAQFEKIGEISDISLYAEIYAKGCLIEWLKERTGKDSFVRNTKEAKNICCELDGMDDVDAVRELERVLLEVDPLHGWSAFNLGVSYSKQGRNLDALMLFLIQAFDMNWDGEAWANAVACAFSKDVPKDAFGICVILALRLGGDNFSQAFDKVLKDNEMSEELVAAFDESLEMAHAGIATSSSDESVTLRIFGDDYSAEVFHVG